MLSPFEMGVHLIPRYPSMLMGKVVVQPLCAISNSNIGFPHREVRNLDFIPDTAHILPPNVIALSIFLAIAGPWKSSAISECCGSTNFGKSGTMS